MEIEDWALQQTDVSIYFSFLLKKKLFNRCIKAKTKQKQTIDQLVVAVNVIIRK